LLDNTCGVTPIVTPLKSMLPSPLTLTTHADNSIWQDVYHPVTQAGDVYLKLTVMEDVLVVSFKEL
jgi:motility quorum-sensing regulator/GCU-specific mRNA interferase toxin